MTHEQSPKPSQPCKRALHRPPMRISSQHSSILTDGFFVVRALGNDRHDIAIEQEFPQRVAVISSIRNEPFDCQCMRSIVERSLDQPDFCGCRGVKICAQWSASFVCGKHPLRAFPLLCLAYARAPFLAGAKLPSSMVSSISSPPFSNSFSNDPCHIRSQAPSSSHFLRRRQQVTYAP